MLRSFDKVAENYDRVESEYMKILYYDLDKGFEDTYRSYNSYRLCTMLTGTKEVAINGDQSFEYTPNEFVLLPPNSSVDMVMKSHTKAVVFELNSQLINKVSDRIELKLGDEGIYKHNYTSSLQQSVDNIKKDMFYSSVDKKFFLDLHAQELVYELLKQQEAIVQPLKAYNPVKIACEIIEQEGNERITIKEIADLLGMSQSNLIYYFKKEVNITPKMYQNRLKLQRGKTLLLTHNVTEVSMALGFDNISYFIRLFKQYYGMTPKQYTQQLKKEENTLQSTILVDFNAIG